MQVKLTEAVGLYDHLATARAAAVEHERAAANAQRRSWQQPAYGYPHHQPYPSSSSQGGYPYAHQPSPAPAWGSDPYGQPQHQRQAHEPYPPGQYAYGRPPVSQTPSWSGYPPPHSYEHQQPAPAQQQQHLPSTPVGSADVYPQLPEGQPSQPPQRQHQHQQPSYPVEPYPLAENAWSGPPSALDGSGQQPTLHSPPTSPIQHTPYQPQLQQQPERAPSQPSYFPPASQQQQQQPSSPTAPMASPAASAFPTAPVSQPLSSAFPAVPADAPAEGDRATAEWAAVGEQQHSQQRQEPEEALLISF